MDYPAADIGRVVALGASNLTRGFHSIVSAARSTWGSEIQVLAALGHGRSYGADSSVAFRTLPGILQSGLWRRLESLPQVPTRALVTDVGNDILYGYPAEQILEWIDQVLFRLQRTTNDIILAGLPLASMRRLSPAKFLIFRSILFPRCRLSLSGVLAIAERIDNGLVQLASARSVRYFKLNPSWYGFDPIHIRPSLWRSAWQEILQVDPGKREESNWVIDGIRLYLKAPERRRLFGIEQFTPQPGVMLPKGGRIWLY
jgi:hypothetical protein